jgi:hypothetical protein
MTAVLLMTTANMDERGHTTRALKSQLPNLCDLLLSGNKIPNFFFSLYLSPPLHFIFCLTFQEFHSKPFPI